MTGFLRFAGILNAAIWLGGALFFTFWIGPALFSEEMKTLLQPKNYPYFSGAIAQIIISRYFHLHIICGLVGIILLGVEWLYLGKAAPQWLVTLVAGLLALGLIGGFWLQPRLKQLHTIKYAVNSTPERREAADKSFKSWHGASQGVNLVMLLGLGVYLWRMANPPDPTRFVSTAKFRS